MRGEVMRTGYLTPEQYLEIEEKADFKSEYWNGQMYARAGGTPRHSDAASGLLVALRTRLKGKGCGVFNSDLRIRDNPKGLYTYPDVAIVCGEPLLGPGHTLTNPIALFEVLSPSTEARDRGFKFEQYQLIESLREYVLVSQEKPRVESFFHTAQESWVYHAVEGFEAAVSIQCVGIEVPLAEIYDGITFRDWFPPTSPAPAV
ncbi:MAG TPA: Uma2 family endonuclease [Bryobacteraceae bacterium]|jgi:Uma2 family endonuclease